MIDPSQCPTGFAKWNRALRGAFRKGRQARVEGKPLSDCPYEDLRKCDGRLSWSRAFIAAWRDGWRWEEDLARKSHITDYYTDLQRIYPR
jgi:hypothetical protein